MSRQLVRDQRGIASIIIVTVIVSVVLMIALGFANIVRREQRQALDLRLSSQAKLAAETVLNEKIAEFRNDPASFDQKDDCGATEQTFTDADSHEIQTTCVLVDKAPGSLEYDEVSTDSSTIVWLDTDKENLDKLVISWQNIRSAAGNDCKTSTYDTLPKQGAGNQLGMLRFDLIKVTDGAGSSTLYNRDQMRKNTFGGVLYPTKHSSRVAARSNTVGTNNQPVIFGTCGDNHPDVDDHYLAHATINLNPNNTNRYVLRLKGIYRPSMVKINGYKVGNKELDFKDAQIVIEATARVNDIVQRLQARVPAGTPPKELVPDDALHVTNGICKMLVTEPASTSNPGC